MAVFEKFREEYGKPVEAEKIESGVIEKYRGKVPDLLISLWEDEGVGGYFSEYFDMSLWTINPDDYVGYMEKWGKKLAPDLKYYTVTPIMRTSYGDIFTLARYNNDNVNEEFWLNLFDVNNHKDNHVYVREGFEEFFEKYLVKKIWEVPHQDLNIDRDKLKPVSKDTVYGFVKPLKDGGKEDCDNIEVVNIHSYLKKQTDAISGTGKKIKNLIKKRKDETKNLLFNKIADDNLKLAVIDELAGNSLPKPEGDDIFFKLFKRKREYDDGYDPIEEIKDYLLSMEVKDEFLKEVKEIFWDSPPDCADFIWPLWDGECDYFNLADIEGIDTLENLESISGILVGFKNLSPLTKLKNFESLEIEAYEPFLDLSPLSEIKSLKKVSFRALDNQKNKDVISELEKRGVDCEVDWAADN